MQPGLVAFDAQEAQRALQLLIEPGATFELRLIVPTARAKEIRSGYFNDPTIAVEQLALLHRHVRPSGAYVTMNPLASALFARAANHLRVAGQGDTTGDHHVIRRARLLIDVDGVPVAGVSSTDSEHEAALKLAEEIENCLIGRGWAQPLRGDSGNGGHLLFAVELPVDDAGLVGHVLAAAQARWGRTANGVTLKVDITNKNPSRITKLFGTRACKGDNLPERPHRMSRIISAPSSLAVVTREQLEDFVAENGSHRTAGTKPTAKPSTKPKTSTQRPPALDLVAWFAKHEVAVRSTPWTGQHGTGTRHELQVCPHNPDHNRGEAYVVQLENGAIAAGCQHESCKWDWAWYRAQVEGHPPNGSATPPSGPPHTSSYVVHDGAIHKRTDGENGPSYAKLCNFSARIEEEIALDDGAEVERVYRIAAILDDGTALPTASVRARDYARLEWIGDAWGARAVVTAGPTRREQLREAIQLLSQPTQRHVYRSSGWCDVGGSWVYLFHGGAVGANDISVELDRPLDRLVLPAEVHDRREAVACSLRLLKCGPATVMIPLLACIYLAPVAFIVEPDFVVFLVGITGALKSELAALCQAHFGRFTRRSLPASWTSTENSIESTLFLLKDALAVVDDYAPQADPRSQRELERVATRVIRNVGNRASRGRLRSDLSRRPDRPPRGLVLTTGEQLPPGSSIQARCSVVEVDRDQLKLDEVTVIQQHIETLPHAMRGYVGWLAPQIPRLKQTLTRRKEELRIGLAAGGHLRQADALAQLGLGIELLSEYAVAVGAMTSTEAIALRSNTIDALVQTGHREKLHHREADPARRYLDVLRALRVQGRLQLVHRDATRLSEDSDRVPVFGEMHHGWYDAEFAYLLPDVTRKSVVGFLREADESWPHTSRATGKALVHAGFVIPGTDFRAQSQVRVGGVQQRVYKMPLYLLDGDEVEADDSAPAAPAVTNARSTAGTEIVETSCSVNESVPVVPGSQSVERESSSSTVDDDADDPSIERNTSQGSCSPLPSQESGDSGYTGNGHSHATGPHQQTLPPDRRNPDAAAGTAAGTARAGGAA